MDISAETKGNITRKINEMMEQKKTSSDASAKAKKLKKEIIDLMVENEIKAHETEKYKATYYENSKRNIADIEKLRETLKPKDRKVVFNKPDKKEVDKLNEKYDGALAALFETDVTDDIRMSKV